MATVFDFHVHLYFDADQLVEAQRLGSELQHLFGVPLGHFHTRAVGPHPRGYCQATVPAGQFGEVATWLSVNRRGLTIFAHASTGDDHADHSRNVIWFGQSEPLDLSIFS